MRRQFLISLLALACISPAMAGMTPELQKQVRAATFEVVLKKPAEDSIKYEKPLPLELLPYIERTDAYRSVGTAFALQGNLYVTAAHVLIPAVGSLSGTPALRTSDGHVHPVASIVRFSAAEDFAVFSVVDDLQAVPLPVNRSPHLDEAVLAVGNALGEGIVIRDGIFTSETPEEQDGRWKWIRFSAAASPGNSGGPLLDGSGQIIGVVIAKSPNENLNYALPIGIVLDAPPSKAVFDQRVLAKVAWAHATKTYMLKDEFALPATWDSFAQQYQATVARHTAKARSELLAANADKLFPRGEGTESVFFTADFNSREIGLVLQQEDDHWMIQSPDFRFTDLPGDGRVGIASAAGSILLALHRGNEASDATFYSDSSAFMDVALKALDIRRTMGTDRVKVTSLGRATADTMVTDAYGRRWQLRTWPIPFMDVSLVVQLLPTPDGYFGLISYAPSGFVPEAREELALLAGQATLTYSGTLNQWQAYLKRTALLPDAFRNASVDAGPTFRLHTRRFDMAVPPTVISLGAHSELLLPMRFVHDGQAVAWDAASAWWYADATEKNYVGLWRQGRPPLTAKLETRTAFEDLQNRRSPYDGAPVRAASDAIDVSMSIQAPGSRTGAASADLMYALTMRLPLRLSPDQLASQEKDSLAAIHILEHGGGADVSESAPLTAASQRSTQLATMRESLKNCDAGGRDLRGRTCTQDYDDFLEPLRLSALQSGMDSDKQQDLQKQLSTRSETLRQYWSQMQRAMHNRDLWADFLSHNHLPPDTQHNAAILESETRLSKAAAAGGMPDPTWTQQAHQLADAYVAERAQLAREHREDSPGAIRYTKRHTSCPAPVTRTSGRDRPMPGPVFRNLEEFYPASLQRLGIEGLVVLSVKVDTGGCAQEIAITGSSGADALDRAALDWVETASFLPAEKDGKAVEGVGPLAVNFKLNN